MAKIDTSTIEGYAEMSVEDKLKALEGFEYEDNAAELERLKNANSKANSEAAEWKRKHNALLDEEQLKQQEKETEYQKVLDELAGLKKEKELSDLTASYIAMGYDKDLAADTAKARMEGDKKKEFENGEKHRQALEKKIKEELMKDTPRPGGSGGGSNEKDPAVEKAVELAKARYGAASKSYEDIMSKYM